MQHTLYNDIIDKYGTILSKKELGNRYGVISHVARNLELNISLTLEIGTQRTMITTKTLTQ